MHVADLHHLRGRQADPAPGDRPDHLRRPHPLTHPPRSAARCTGTPALNVLRSASALMITASFAAVAGATDDLYASPVLAQC
jgi:hypothetical protein